jgi:glycosyltransferase involved in cell wall biosynthesis
MLAQERDNWELVLVADGEIENEDEIHAYTQKYSNILLYRLDHRGEWGHVARNYGLEMTETEWVVLSGHDNYYVPCTTAVIEDAINAYQGKIDVVYWNMIHNYFQYTFKETEWVPGRIDIGSFATRTELVRKAGGLQLTAEDNRNADGVLVMDLEALGARKCKVESCLFVHN